MKCAADKRLIEPNTHFFLCLFSCFLVSIWSVNLICSNFVSSLLYLQFRHQEEIYGKAYEPGVQVNKIWSNLIILTWSSVLLVCCLSPHVCLEHPTHVYCLWGHWRHCLHTFLQHSKLPPTLLPVQQTALLMKRREREEEKSFFTVFILHSFYIVRIRLSKHHQEKSCITWPECDHSSWTFHSPMTR